jgi:predicted  nucleic acid-binding Zn-ribbon protein
MYEIYALHRKIEVLERELQTALERIDRLETALRIDEMKIKSLAADVEHEQEVIERLEHEIPGHGVPVGL